MCQWYVRVLIMSLQFCRTAQETSLEKIWRGASCMWESVSCVLLIVSLNIYLHLTNFLTGIFAFIFFVLQDKASVDPFPIPLAIVGGKYDIYQVSSLLTPEKNDIDQEWASQIMNILCGIISQEPDPNINRNLTWLWKKCTPYKLATMVDNLPMSTSSLKKSVLIVRWHSPTVSLETNNFAQMN